MAVTTSVDPEVLDVDSFIKVKGFKAKGKRLTTYTIDEITELEPTRFPEPPYNDSSNDSSGEPGTEDSEEQDPDIQKSDDEIRDEQTGQLRLF